MFIGRTHLVFRGAFLCVLMPSPFQFIMYFVQTSLTFQVKWVAPEFYKLDPGPLSHENDVWAYGITLWEIATLAMTPYPSMTVFEVMPFVAGGGRMDPVPWLSGELRAVIDACWQSDPVRAYQRQLILVCLCVSY